MWLSNEDFVAIYSKVPRLCVDVLVRTEEGVLLVWRDIEPEPDRWHIPGGTVYFEESLEVAANRILESELGIKAERLEQFAVCEYPDENDKLGFKRHSVSVVYLAMVETREVEKILKTGKVEIFKEAPELISVKQLRVVEKALISRS